MNATKLRRHEQRHQALSEKLTNLTPMGCARLVGWMTSAAEKSPLIRRELEAFEWAMRNADKTAPESLKNFA
jgi:hypothetical protein